MPVMFHTYSGTFTKYHILRHICSNWSILDVHIALKMGNLWWWKSTTSNYKTSKLPTNNQNIMLWVRQQDMPYQMIQVQFWHQQNSWVARSDKISTKFLKLGLESMSYSISHNRK